MFNFFVFGQSLRSRPSYVNLPWLGKKLGFSSELSLPKVQKDRDNNAAFLIGCDQNYVNFCYKLLRKTNIQT